MIKSEAETGMQTSAVALMCTNMSLCTTNLPRLSISHLSGGEGKGGSDGGGSHRKEGEEADAPGVIPGIVGAIVVAVAGAISSFIAYQKKKLCFKENEQGEVDMESHRNANAEPAVQRTLLEK